jgi:hypothetical protein
MLGLFFLVILFGRTMWLLLTDATFRSMVFAGAFILACGTSFYTLIEGWPVIDALYFSVASLTTVGYGDFTPSSTGSKIFTIAYLLSGVALLMGFINAAAALRHEHFMERRQERTSTESDSAS